MEGRPRPRALARAVPRPSGRVARLPHRAPPLPSCSQGTAHGAPSRRETPRAWPGGDGRALPKRPQWRAESGRRRSPPGHAAPARVEARQRPLCDRHAPSGLGESGSLRGMPCGRAVGATAQCARGPSSPPLPARGRTRPSGRRAARQGGRPSTDGCACQRSPGPPRCPATGVAKRAARHGGGRWRRRCRTPGPAKRPRPRAAAPQHPGTAAPTARPSSDRDAPGAASRRVAGSVDSWPYRSVVAQPHICQAATIERRVGSVLPLSGASRGSGR